MNRRVGQWAWILVALLVLAVGPSSGWAASNTFPVSGNVGIGTTTPLQPLDLHGIFQFSGALVNGYFSMSSTSMLFTNNYYWNGANQVPDTTRSSWTVAMSSALGTPSTNFDVYMRAPGAVAGMGTNLLRITGAGNVGIGTTSPAQKLDVAGNANFTGNVTVSGNIAAKYQDVAEWVPTRAKEALPAGTVLVIDTQAKNEVLPAAQPYDTRVAGVVSAQPGLLLGEGGDGKVKVAHSGRVPVMVDASYGPIAVGDLLVTSPTEGYAMRSTPVDLGGVKIHRPGTLIGKALEPLANGKGEILVLLTLQ